MEDETQGAVADTLCSFPPPGLCLGCACCKESPPTLFCWLDFCVWLEPRAEAFLCTPYAPPQAEEAMATYRTCVADAKTQKQELEDTKVTALRQIQEVIRQSDQTIKSVGARCSRALAMGSLSGYPCKLLTSPPVPHLPQATISYYQMMHMQTAPLPVHFQMLCESSKLYDPGQQYASHVRQLQRDEEPDVHYDFEPHVPTNTWYGHGRMPWELASHLKWGQV